MHFHGDLKKMVVRTCQGIIHSEALIMLFSDKECRLIATNPDKWRVRHSSGWLSSTKDCLNLPGYNTILIS